MKIMKSAKYFGLIAILAGFAVGCTTTEEPAPEEPKAEAPPPPAAEPTPEPVAAAPAMGSYEVVRGDNLWNISGRPSIYNNPYQWPLIYKANSGKIQDADLIYPGQVFDIDNNPTAGDVDAAVNHAKTRGSWSLGAVEESDKAYLAR